MTFVKICGITNLADALSAVEAGADALSFNFYCPSPRHIESNAARAIIDQLPATVMSGGVLVNEASPERVEQLAGAAGWAALRLYGWASPRHCNPVADGSVLYVCAAA